MVNQDKLLSIIIVSFRNFDVLGDCLNSIARFNDLGDMLETIVVEQSEDKNSPIRIQSEWPWTKVIPNHNVGFGGGNNRGAAEAHGKYLLLLNPDTLIVEPVFSFAIEQFSHDQSLGAFGVRLLDQRGQRNRSFHFRKPYGLFRSAFWRTCDRFEWFLPQSMYIAGADLFVRASAYHRIGGFDERMFMYFEETYLCSRLNDAGFKIGYFPQKHIVHLEGQSSAGINTLEHQIESLRYLCEDTGTSYTRILRLMKRDRVIKTHLGSDRSSEIALIDEVLSKEAK